MKSYTEYKRKKEIKEKKTSSMQHSQQYC